MNSISVYENFPLDSVLVWKTQKEEKIEKSVNIILAGVHENWRLKTVIQFLPFNWQTSNLSHAKLFEKFYSKLEIKYLFVKKWKTYKVVQKCSQKLFNPSTKFSR